MGLHFAPKCWPGSMPMGRQGAMSLRCQGLIGQMLLVTIWRPDLVAPQVGVGRHGAGSALPWQIAV